MLVEETASALSQLEQQAGEMSDMLKKGAEDMQQEVDSGGFLDTVSGFFRSIGIVDPCDFVEKNRDDLEGQEKDLAVALDRIKALESAQLNDGLTTLATAVGALGAGSLGYYAFKRYEPRMDYAVDKVKGTIDQVSRLSSTLENPMDAIKLESFKMPGVSIHEQTYGQDVAVRALAGDKDPAQTAAFGSPLEPGTPADKARQVVSIFDPTGITGWPDLSRSWDAWKSGDGSGLDVFIDTLGVIPFLNPVKAMAKGAKATRAGLTVAKRGGGGVKATLKGAGEFTKRSVTAPFRKAPGKHGWFWSSEPGSFAKGLGPNYMKALEQNMPSVANVIKWMDANPKAVIKAGYGAQTGVNFALQQFKGTPNEKAILKRILEKRQAALPFAAGLAAVPLGTVSTAWYTVGKVLVIAAATLLVYRAMVKLAPGVTCTIKEMLTAIGGTLVDSAVWLVKDVVGGIVRAIIDLGKIAFDKLSSFFSESGKLDIDSTFKIIREWNDINDSAFILASKHRCIL